MINRESDIPYFKQLHAIIENDIANGVYKTGDKLPSENDLCARYDVSRTTVRQALNLLLQQDLVYSVHGKGTFVKLPELNHELSKVVSFGKVLEASGIRGYTKMISFDTFKGGSKASEYLGQDIFRMALMGYAKDAPVVYYESFIRSDYRDMMYDEAEKLEMQHKAFSTYDIYKRLGKKIGRIDQKLHAISADERLTKLFGRTVDPLVLIKLESIYYDESNVPIEYKTAYYRADVYSFELKREVD